MKIICKILMKDNSIIKKVIKNPSDKFVLSYPIDGELQDFEYKFKRENVFTEKGLFGNYKVIFFEHASSDSLSPKFVTNETLIQDINKFANNSLLRELVASTKKNKAEMNFKIILGLAGIVGLVLIVVLG